MDINKQKEQFSLAYIHAVASAAGYAVYDYRVDDQSSDIGLAGYETGLFCEDPKLDIQAKCTENPNFISGGFLSFNLKQKNYDDLRKRAAVPRILVVMIVPDQAINWLAQSPNELVLRHCAYWVSILGKPDLPQNQNSANVRIPLSQAFDADALKKIMRQLADGEKP